MINNYKKIYIIFFLLFIIKIKSSLPAINSAIFGQTYIISTKEEFDFLINAWRNLGGKFILVVNVRLLNTTNQDKSKYYNSDNWEFKIALNFFSNINNYINSENVKFTDFLKNNKIIVILLNSDRNILQPIIANLGFPDTPTAHSFHPALFIGKIPHSGINFINGQQITFRSYPVPPPPSGDDLQILDPEIISHIETNIKKYISNI